LSAKRIVSLVPSITELLVDLGLETAIVGVTKFCVHPKHLRKNTTIIGGTKNLRLEVIRQLQPDLILANKEENVREQVEALAAEFKVYTSDISNFDDFSAIRIIL
jgi:ABC-type hemin transport system substrate-binding protein